TNGLDAVEHRHRNVGNYHIGAEPFNGGDELPTIRDGTRDIELGLKQPLQSFNNNFVVISDQYPRSGHALPLNGINMSIPVPFPGAAFMDIVPLISRTRSLILDRPRPA